MREDLRRREDDETRNDDQTTDANAEKPRGREETKRGDERGAAETIDRERWRVFTDTPERVARGAGDDEQGC